MPSINEWAAKAAERIASEYDLQYSAILDGIAAIIAEHCPFKPDHEYWEAPTLGELNGIRFNMETDVPTLQRMCYTNYQSYAAACKRLGEQRRKSKEKIDALVSLLRESKREHAECVPPISHDCCPCAVYQHPPGQACDCGADAWNAKVDAALEEK